MYNNVPLVGSSYANTGLQTFQGYKGDPLKLIAVPPGAYIATKTLAETVGTWEANFNAAMTARWLPIGKIVDGEFPSPDAVYKETSFGFKYFIKDNKPTFKYMIEPISDYNIAQLAQLSGKKFDFYIATDKEKIAGWANGDEFRPYTASFFRVYTVQESGIEIVWVEIQFDDINQFNSYRAIIDPSLDSEAPVNWYPSLEFVGVKDLIATATAGSASGFTLQLLGFDGTPYNSAVKEDIAIYKGTSETPIAATGCTASGDADGKYAVTYATQTAGTFHCGLLPVNEATTKGFETPDLGDVTWS